MDVSKIQLLDQILNIKDSAAQNSIGLINNDLEDINSNISKMTNDIDILKDNVNNKALIFTDSYGKYIPTKLFDDYGHKIFWRDGANFNANDNNTFYNWIGAKIDSVDINDYRQIIFIGGFNDRSASQESIINGMTQTYNFLKTKIGSLFSQYKISVGHIGWSSTLDSDVRDLVCTNSLPAYRKSPSCGMPYMTNIEYVLHDYSIFNTDNVHPNTTGGQLIANQIFNYIYEGTCDVHKDYKICQIVGGNNVSASYNVAYRLDNDLITVWLPYNAIHFTNPVEFKSDSDITLLQIEPSTATTRGYVMGMYDAQPNLSHFITLNGYVVCQGTPQFRSLDGVQFYIYGGFLHCYNNKIKADGTGFDTFFITDIQIRGCCFTIPTLLC